MDKIPQHQCLIYKGSPAKTLTALAIMIRQRLAQDFRCLYLNSPSMVAGMRSYLSAAGVRVAEEIDATDLVLSSDQGHLTGGRFDIDRMMEMLDEALNKALRDGYRGLWASGDMTWEFGAEKDFGKLLEYEWRLEEYFRNHPALVGICQYHADTLPRDTMRQGMLTHPAIFLNDTLSRINPQFLEPRSYPPQATTPPALDEALENLLESPA